MGLYTLILAPSEVGGSVLELNLGESKCK